MTIYVMRNGKIVPKDQPPRRINRVHAISDDLGADLEHMAYADGRRTSSKSQFRQWTKDAGCVEKGNDREPAQSRPPDDLRADVGHAINMVKQGYRPTIPWRED